MASEKDEEVIVIGNDGLDDIERNILIETFGKEEAEKLLNEQKEEAESLDEELQEIVDGAPALDEI
jgi:hypothetical protein